MILSLVSARVLGRVELGVEAGGEVVVGRDVGDDRDLVVGDALAADRALDVRAGGDARRGVDRRHLDAPGLRVAVVAEVVLVELVLLLGIVVVDGQLGVGAPGLARRSRAGATRW